MGQAGDLLLVFADHLTRSWKQITKFRSPGAEDPARGAEVAAVPLPLDSGTRAEATPISLEGLIRDERGIRFAPEGED